MARITLTAPTYTASKASQGIGAFLYIGLAVGASGTATWTPVLELTEMPFSGEEWDKLERTNFNSIGGVKEYGKGTLDPGTVSIKGNAITNDPGQMALAAALADPTSAYQFVIQMPVRSGQTTSGDQYQWNALVLNGSELSSLAPQKDIEISYKLQNTGPIVKVSGT
jgi:hypothetical protein